MQIVQALHTALLVADLAQAERFYGEILGLEKVNRPLKYPGAWYQIGDYQVHLIADATRSAALHNPDKWGRNHHIAFGVVDLDQAKATLLLQGYSVQLSASGRAALFTQDPDGNVVELSQL